MMDKDPRLREAISCVKEQLLTHCHTGDEIMAVLACVTGDMFLNLDLPDPEQEASIWFSAIIRQMRMLSGKRPLAR